MVDYARCLVDTWTLWWTHVADRMDDCYDEIAALRGKAAPGTTFVRSETGGVKGQKAAQFSRIPFDVLTELAVHYGVGAKKYPDDPETHEANWMKGYRYDLNIDALMRHLALWVGGEDFDEETGSSHLMAVAWHAITLRWFQLHGRGTDTRVRS